MKSPQSWNFSCLATSRSSHRLSTPPTAGQGLFQESVSVATKAKAIGPTELSRVIVDTTVQPKNVTLPTDAKLLNQAREKLVRLAKIHGVDLRQSYARLGKFALIRHQRDAHAKQFKRANRMLKKLRTLLGRVVRDTSAARSTVTAGSKGRSQSCYCWRGASTSRSSTSAGRRSIPCMRRKSNASARARPIGLMSSASR